MSAIQDHLASVKKRISEYEIKYGREVGSVKLLAASKGQSSDKICDAYQAGQRIFGENYLQEALDKMADLATYPLEWHFIGSIQSNKTKHIAEQFAWVQSVNNKKIAERLSKQRPSQLPPLNICIEVNISHEATKSGAKIREVAELASACLNLPNLKLRGLMAIPEPYKGLNEQRLECRKLYSLWEALRQQGMPLDTLSMGMSQDIEAAIAEGATLVRIGTAIFGERNRVLNK